MEGGIDLRRVYRLVALIVAGGLWAISVDFSVQGFSFIMTNQKFATIGLILSLSVTAIELIWSHDKNQSGLTLAAIGIICYAYGVYTNVVGISQAQGGTGITPFAIALGLLLEIAPEPLFVWAVYGPNKEGSFFDNLFGKGAKAFSNGPKQEQNKHTQMSGGGGRPPVQMGGKKGGGGKPPSFSEMRERARIEVMGGNGSGRPQLDDED